MSLCFVEVSWFVIFSLICRDSVRLYAAGKTVCLLSLITSYQYANPSAGKLVYCTRTVPEMNHCMEELATVLAYRSEILHPDLVEEEDVPMERDMEDSMGVDKVESGGSSKRPRRIVKPNKKKMGAIADGHGAGGTGDLALCLSSRRNMCIHERVMSESDREAVDSACRSMTASWVLEANQKRPGSMETCPYYDNFQAAGESMSMPSGVYDLTELQNWGKNRGWCPYYLTRQAINHANILVFNYQYMLDPKVAKMVSKELESESIIVFGEFSTVIPSTL